MIGILIIYSSLFQFGIMAYSNLHKFIRKGVSLFIEGKVICCMDNELNRGSNADNFFEVLFNEITNILLNHSQLILMDVIILLSHLFPLHLKLTLQI